MFACSLMSNCKGLTENRTHWVKLCTYVCHVSVIKTTRNGKTMLDEMSKTVMKTCPDVCLCVCVWHTHKWFYVCLILQLSGSAVIVCSHDKRSSNVTEQMTFHHLFLLVPCGTCHHSSIVFHIIYLTHCLSPVYSLSYPFILQG